MELAAAPQPWGVGSMMEQDLIRIMAGTPSHEMFIVSKIEEVIRWNIGIDGLPGVDKASTPNLLFACENTLSKDVILPSARYNEGSVMSDAVFDLAPFYPDVLDRITRRPEWETDYKAFHVWGLRYGLTGVWCKVGLTDKAVRICAVDGDTGLRLGDCDDRFIYYRNRVLYHPATRFASLYVHPRRDIQAARSRHCEGFLKSGATDVAEACMQFVTFERIDHRHFRVHHEIEFEIGEVIRIAIGASHTSAGPTVTMNEKPARFDSTRTGKTCVTDVERGWSLCLSDGA
jgi:hypothetical protein